MNIMVNGCGEDSYTCCGELCKQPGADRTNNNVTSQIESLTFNQQLRQICASAVGSISATLFLNPLNVIKVRYQNSTDTQSVLQVVRGVYQSNGFKGFFSGLRIGVFQSLPGTIIYMSTYEKIKRKILLALEADGKNKELHLGPLVPGVAAGMSRLVSVSAVSPIEYIRTLQSGGNLGSTLNISRDIWRDRGIKGFYRGWSATILRDAPYSMIYWLCFETFRPIFENRLYSIDRNNRNNSINSYNSSKDVNAVSGIGNQKYYASTNFICGALSGAIAAFSTHPMDVIKTKQQLLALDQPRLGAIDTLRYMVKTLGFFSLYKGLALRLAIVIPSGAIMVTVYEAAKHLEI